MLAKAYTHNRIKEGEIKGGKTKPHVIKSPTECKITERKQISKRIVKILDRIVIFLQRIWNITNVPLFLANSDLRKLT